MSVSWNPETFVAGGLIDDVDAEIREARLVEWDYEGQIENPVLALAVKFQPLNAEGKPDGDEVVQHYSAGDLSRFQPSPDGKTAVSVGNAKSLSNKTNAAAFIVSAINCGFPADRLNSGDVSVIEGMVCHVNRVAQEKRTGLANQSSGGREPQVLIITKIISLPGESRTVAKGKTVPAKNVAGKPAAVAPKAPAAPAPAPQVEASVEAMMEAFTLIGEVATEAGGSIERSKLQMALFKKLNTNKSPNRTAILNLVKSDQFIAEGAEAGVYGFDGKTITAAA